MRIKEARALGKRIAGLVGEGKIVPAYEMLAHVMEDRTHFAMLRRIAKPVASAPREQVDEFLDLIALDGNPGGWAVIGKVLQVYLDQDLAGVFARCHDFIVMADVWHATDTLAEGVAGQALVDHFEPALDLLLAWRDDPDHWVRRAVGVAVHLWAKRSRGAEDLLPRAEQLLALLEPMFGEWDMTTVKGVGWGLKTMGKQYPDLVTAWLLRVVPEQARYRALMLRKATTYLPKEQKVAVKLCAEGEWN